MKRMTFAEVVAVVALLVAVYFGVRYWNMIEEIKNRLGAVEAMCGNPPGDGRRASLNMVHDLRDEVEQVAARVKALDEALFPDGQRMTATEVRYRQSFMPEVIRTTSGEKPTIRNVEE